MPWDDFVRTRIFKPLGMNSTVLSDAEWAASDHATGYRYDWRRDQTVLHKPGETATVGSAGAVKSSARDMANWLRFQLAEGAFDGVQLVNASSLAETKSPHTVIRLEGASRDSNPDSHLMSYGLGWIIQDYRGEMLVSHSGALNGFRTHVDLLPRHNAGFVVMANVGRGHALIALRNALADILTNKPSRDWNAYYLMIERKANEKEERDRQELLAKRVNGTSTLLAPAAYAGTYESAAHGPARITADGERLVLHWQKVEVPLTHFHYDVFLAESVDDDLDEQLTFRFSPERTITGFTLFGTEFVRKP
jgi:hypothetical protein